ncbi:unnamed protein product [Diamesa tonsa]
MNNLLRILSNRVPACGLLNARNISVTATTHLKEIEISQEKEVITIKGKYVASPREDFVFKGISECKQNGQKFCPECTLGLEIKHTDVLILSQYLREDGCMLPRRITGLCKKQQKKIGTMATMAQKAGLMPNLAPAWSKNDPKSRYGYKKYNKYFYESTIKC